MKFLSKVQAIIGICCVIVAVAVGFGVYGMFTRSPPRIETRMEINSELLEASVKQIAELSTISYRYTEIGFFVDQTTVAIFGRDFNIPGTARSFIVRFTGDIRLGIDVSQVAISVYDICAQYNNIVVSVPGASILTHAIDISSIQLLDESTGVFTSLDLDDFTYFIAGRQQEVELGSEVAALLLSSQESAEGAIYAMLRAVIGDIGHTIEFVRQL